MENIRFSNSSSSPRNQFFRQNTTAGSTRWYGRFIASLRRSAFGSPIPFRSFGLLRSLRTFGGPSGDLRQHLHIYDGSLPRNRATAGHIICGATSIIEKRRRVQVIEQPFLRVDVGIARIHENFQISGVAVDALSSYRMHQLFGALKKYIFRSLKHGSSSNVRNLPEPTV